MSPLNSGLVSDLPESASATFQAPPGTVTHTDYTVRHGLQAAFGGPRRIGPGSQGTPARECAPRKMKAAGPGPAAASGTWSRRHAGAGAAIQAGRGDASRGTGLAAVTTSPEERSRGAIDAMKARATDFLDVSRPSASRLPSGRRPERAHGPVD
jgi:hypothetical protein